MNKQKIKNKKVKGQEGQALVEFALIVPIMLLLLLIPIDLYQVINTKMILNSAASESIAKLDYYKLTDGNLEKAVLDMVEKDFGDKLARSKIKITHLVEKGPESEDYTSYVYSSELANENPDDFQKQFQNRNANYNYKEIELQLSYNVKPVVFWKGLWEKLWENMLVNDVFEVKTPIYQRNVYMSGYSSPDGGD